MVFAMVLSILVLPVFILAALTYERFEKPIGHDTHVECCVRCYSTREHYYQVVFGEFGLPVVRLPDTNVLTFQSDRYPGCTHAWKAGYVTACPKPLQAGEVVLVERDGRYGAIVFRRVESLQSVTDYEVYIADPETGDLNPENPKVQRYDGRTAMNFDSPFGTHTWSTNDRGAGILHYAHIPGAERDGRAPLLRYCLTGELELATLNPADPKWVYRCSVTDPGWSPER